jgi:transposase
MGQKDLLRCKIMAMVQAGQMSLAEAAGQLKVSYRQAKRIHARYRAEGDRGILHRSVGRASNNRVDEELLRQAVEAYRENYAGFGPTFAAEKLLEREGIVLSHETLRRALLSQGLWTRKRRRREYHCRRLPRERFGELVQFDGSHHDWFEGRGPRCCLMNMVDDATGMTMSFLRDQETTVAAMELLWAWIARNGIPQAVYCDRKNAFVLDREPTNDEQLRGITPRSPFEVACERLGIEVIVARSPEAKGRVERNHAVYQDRFVKELRLAGISSIDGANEFLRETYLGAVNGRFSRVPAKPEDAHVPLLDSTDLRDIFCFQETRKVSRDYIIQYGQHLFRIPQSARHHPHPGDSVTIRKWLDGSIHHYWKGRPLLVEEYVIPKPRKENSEHLSA